MQTKPAVKITKKPGMAVQTEVKAGNPSAQPNYKGHNYGF